MFFLAVSLALFGSPTSSPAAVLEHVQRTYSTGGDLQARFTHTYVDKLRGTRPPEFGTLWAKQDGRVRWQYRQPTKKDFVYDGKSVYFYEPENAQVTVFENIEETPLWNAIRFLWGQGKVTEMFAVSTCKSNCLEDSKSLVVLELSPKQPLPSVERALLMVDPKKGQVQRSVLFDALGNRTEYEFTKVELGVALSAARFQFKVPEGVSVLRADSDG